MRTSPRSSSSLVCPSCTACTRPRSSSTLACPSCTACTRPRSSSTLACRSCTASTVTARPQSHWHSEGSAKGGGTPATWQTGSPASPQSASLWLQVAARAAALRQAALRQAAKQLAEYSATAAALRQTTAAAVRQAMAAATWIACVSLRPATWIACVSLRPAGWSAAAGRWAGRGRALVSAWRVDGSHSERTPCHSAAAHERRSASASAARWDDCPQQQQPSRPRG